MFNLSNFWGAVHILTQPHSLNRGLRIMGMGRLPILCFMMNSQILI